MMDSTNNSALNSLKFSKPWLVIFILLALVIAVLTSTKSVREFFNPQDEYRKILAKAFTQDLEKNYVIFKIQTRNSIDIEIYEKTADLPQPRLKQKFSLAGDKDSHLATTDGSVGLVITDIDKDGTMDIVAPTVDTQGQSRLNVFKYDEHLSQFLPVTSTEIENF